MSYVGIILPISHSGLTPFWKITPIFNHKISMNKYPVLLIIHQTMDVKWLANIDFNM